MRRQYLRGIALSLVLAAGAAGQEAPKTQAVLDRIKNDIFYLAGPECEGRGVETKGIDKAADRIAATFKASGLKPGMPDGSYFQPFSIFGRPTLGKDNSLVFKGTDGKEVKPEIDKAFTVTGQSGTGKLEAKGLVFAGYGITRKGDKPYDDYAGLDVAGKAVLVLRKNPNYNDANSGFADYAPLAVKAENAIEHKAAALIFINDKNDAEKDELITFTFARGGGGSVSIPVFHIKRKVADELLAGKGTLAEIEAKIEKELKPASVELADWKVDAQASVDKKEIKVKNVVGVLEGSGPLANETVIIGAHYDHLGSGEGSDRMSSLGRGDDKTKMHPGADDNASGTTGVLELSRRFGAMKDRQGRRIVFMTFAGEERGLLGSVAYCKNPIYPLKDTAAMINMDMIGRLAKDPVDGKNALEIGGVGTAKEFKGIIDKLAVKYKLPVRTSETGNGPSDHQSFNQKKVPVFFLFTGLHNEYHRPTDVPELINVEGIKSVADMAEELAGIMATCDKPVFLDVKGNFNPGAGTRGPSIGLVPGQGAYDESLEAGVPVGGTRKDSPAEKAGLKEGDTIIEVAGKPVKNIAAYMGEMAKARGANVELTVLRGKEKVNIKVELPK